MLFTKLEFKLPDRTPLIFPFMTAIVSIVTMLGWIFKVPFLIQFRPFWGVMMFNSSLCFLLLALCYFSKSKNLIKLFCGAVILICVTTIAQIPLEISVGIDDLFVKPFYAGGTFVAGRMAVSTALCYIFVASSILLGSRGFLRQMSQVALSSLVAGIAMVGIAGHNFAFNPEYGWGSFGRMPMQGMILFLLLSITNLWLTRTNVRRQSEKLLALLPGYVLAIGVLITVLIWQLLVLRDQDRTRNISKLHVEQLKANIDKAVLPIEKGLEHIARHIATGSFENRHSWVMEVGNFISEFKTVGRIFFADKDSFVKWRYPDDANAPKNVKLSDRNATLKEKVSQVEAYRGAFMTEVFNRQLGDKVFILLVPVIKNDKYIGSIGATILVNPFFSQVVPLVGYNLAVLEKNGVVYSKANPDFIRKSDWEVRSGYSNFGAQWTLALTPTAQILRENLSALPMMVMVFGFTISILLAVSLSLYLSTRESEQNSRKVFEWKKAGLDGLPLLIMFMDEKALIQEMNETAERMLEYKTSEVAGRYSPFIFLDPAEIKSFQEKVETETGRGLPLDESYVSQFAIAAAKLGYNRATEWTFVSRSGNRFTVVVSYNEIRDDKGKITGFLAVMEDVTNLRQKEKMIKEQELKIQTSARLASLGEMVAGIAHEINNPLTIISGHVGILRKLLGQKGITDLDLNKKVDSIESVVQRIAKIIHGMRSYVHQPEVALEEVVKVESLIDDTLVFCQDRFKMEGIELSVDIEPNLKIKGLPFQITQVLLNLLNNASDALGHRVDKRIHIAARSVPGGVEISVADNGPGIPAHMRAKIMEPFFTTKEVGKGVGLGLSISQGIMQAHRGEFYLDENHPHAKFILKFPV